MTPPRVAFFTDAYHEVNGVGRLSQAFEAFARERGLPWLAVHGGPRTVWQGGGPVSRLEIARGPWALPFEPDLRIDPLLWRHLGRVRRALESFAPDLVHFTGPSDVGQIGAWLAWRLGIPAVASWHTNVHEFARWRLETWLGWMPPRPRARLAAWTERRVLDAAVQLYRRPRAVMAPNAELAAMLARRIGRPVAVMRHGVDTRRFSPARRDAADGLFRLGLVGRLSPEKNVRLLARLERALLEAGETNWRFVIAGQGRERGWLERHLTRAEFLGVLEPDALARVYANLDAFVFPSETDTFGLVVLEALASGVPVIASHRGGQRPLIDPGVTGFLAADDGQFVDAVIALVRDPARRDRMRAAARHQALAWSWDRAFAEVYSCYAAAIGAPRPPRAPDGAADDEPDRAPGCTHGEERVGDARNTLRGDPGT